MHKPEGCGLESRWEHWIFLTYLIQPHYGPRVDSASNRDEYWKLPGVKGSRTLKLTISPAPLSRLCIKCWSLDVSQPYGPPWPVTRPALPLCSILKKIENKAFRKQELFASSGEGEAATLLGPWEIVNLNSRIPDDGQSPKTRKFLVLYTIDRTLWDLQGNYCRYVNLKY
jgi:hypothetical protein